MGYSKKNKKQVQWGGGVGGAEVINPTRIFHFLTLPLEVPGKTKLHPWKFHKFLFWTEIPHYFFLVTLLGTLFLINPWKFHMLFLWYPWIFHILKPPCLFFSGIDQLSYSLLYCFFSKLILFCNRFFINFAWKRYNKLLPTYSQLATILLFTKVQNGNRLPSYILSLLF